jgi:predicted nucleic acid-binding protein
VYVVDASVWVSRFLPGDTGHEASYQWLWEMIGKEVPLISPALLLSEVAGPISRRTGSSEHGLEAALSISRVYNGELVSLTSDIARVAARTAAQLRLKGADAVYVTVAWGLSFTLVTWDTEQHRAGGIVRVRTPAELLADAL